jgi:phage gp36-like protein
MQEDIIFRRRNRLKKHFVNVSNVLLYCYAFVSDAAKITFQVIDGFDWESKETGESKGYVFPAIETIAKIRHTSVRTIQRHILELIKARLLTRIRQRNKPSILYIEEVSEEEVQKYFAFFEEREKRIDLTRAKKPRQVRNDKNVVSQKASETTKMSFTYKEENERKENEINVNEHFQFTEPKKRSGMQGMRQILKRFDRENLNTISQPANKEKPETIQQRDFLADEIAQALSDNKSLGAFRKIAERVPEVVIRECLAQIKETWQEGKIKKSRGALFISMMQQYSAAHRIDLGFQSAVGSIKSLRTLRVKVRQP